MSFSTDLQKYAKKTGRSHEKLFRGVCLSMGTSVIMRTPVDTGRARGNWQSSISKPKKGTLDRVGGGAAMTELDATVKTLSLGQIFYFSNNLPYIEGLESGTGSKQAPIGMLAVTVANFEKTVERLARI